ncbi:MAG: formate--tetrahydrofolate ligase, partial [Nitrospirae bacterium]
MKDHDVACSVTPRRIGQVGQDLGLRDEELIPYGRFKAKVSLTALERLSDRPKGRYVLVTGINPTP